ncbi:MAG: DUF547 domain-containing protein, partial [Alphaproteobacteria bacterium]|nr:DUF547 domain-containing protein [Alphaproteobacteria bacterium]
MIKKTLSVLLLTILASTAPAFAKVDESKVPEPFRGASAGSPIAIRYDDWSLILKRSVIDG